MFEFKKLAYDQAQGRFTEDGVPQEVPTLVEEGVRWEERWEHAFWMRLQSLGRDGWDLVSASYTEGAPKGFVLLKRVVVNQSPAGTRPARPGSLASAGLVSR